MPTNKSHYPPQAILSDPPRPLGEPTPCLESSRDARDFSSKGRGKTRVVSRRPRPTLTTAAYTEFFEGVSTVVFHPSGIFFRHKRRRATRSKQRDSRTLQFYEWRGESRAKEREREIVTPDTFVAMNETSDGTAPRER